MGDSRKISIAFTKMSGAGNDFVLIDDRAGQIEQPEKLTRVLCTRRLSVGADGLILLRTSTRASVRMLYFNADGSAADFCANGTRCLARFATIVGAAPDEMTIETDAGIIRANVTGEGRVTLQVGEPSAWEQNKPLSLSQGRSVEGSLVRVGVPHYVIFAGAPIWDLEIEATGREVRFHSSLQPDGANVNFVAVRDRHSIVVRTYERGVEGETLACGSGVVASVAASAMFGSVDSPVSVVTRSGISLEVTFKREGEGLREMTLAGDARVIFESHVMAETLAGFDADWVRNPTDRVPEP